MSLSINISASIADCQQDWDSFLPTVHHLRSKHLLAFEKAAVDDIQNNYVQVFKNGEIIGLLYLQQFSFGHQHLNFKTDQAFIGRLIRFILPGRLPILVCGHLFRINFPGFYFKDIADQLLVVQAIELFTKKQLYRPCGVMIKDCNEAFIKQNYGPIGYSFFDGDVTMELARNANWHCFSDYLHHLKKDYRKRAKKILEAFEGVEDKQLTAEDIKLQAKDIERLYWNVVDKQSVKLGTVNAAYFYQLKIDLQQAFEFHALYLQGTMVGFYTFIFYKQEMETHYIGLDYDANKTAKLYFNILFISVKKMIERKDEKLELGRTAREAKANLGAMPRQIFNYIKIGNPLVRITLNHFLRRFNLAENKSIASRNPLK